ncbi:hypothetical protein NXS19_004315 [Fusarium pseudograminearum]|nr:hypothetical protein NXS19_004315 [Fusarium pseudograminearum]
MPSLPLTAVTIEMETDDPVPVSTADDTVDAAPAEPSVIEAASAEPPISNTGPAESMTVDATPAEPSIADATPAEPSFSNVAPAELMIVDATPTEEIEMNNTDITVTVTQQWKTLYLFVPLMATSLQMMVSMPSASVTRDTAMEDPEPVAITGGGGVVGTTVQR